MPDEPSILNKLQDTIDDLGAQWRRAYADRHITADEAAAIAAGLQRASRGACHAVAADNAGRHMQRTGRVSRDYAASYLELMQD